MRSEDFYRIFSLDFLWLVQDLCVKIMREEKRQKAEEVVELEETVLKLRQQSEKERLSALELEAVLANHKQRVEKQRRQGETQSSYRLCLERMIRDTMHP
jgi:ribosomal protein S7